MKYQEVKFSTVVYFLICLFIHPIKFLNCLEHCSVNDHKFNMDVVNFNYDLWCHDCNEVFLDEIK
jgi:hypothetical protein